jgi:endonuclease-3
VTNSERAAHVLRRLAELYPETPVPLDHEDAFTLLIAVLLSAQCTDIRVNQITPKLFGELGKAIVRPCGLGPQKAKAIRRLSEILLEEHEGKVPADLDALERLPGVGHKTAQVVMAQAFGVASFPVDTHIHRLAQRWKLTNGRSVLQTERDLKRLFPMESWNALHLQIIFYGREYCSARGCDGTVCPLCRELFPERVKAVKAKKA